MTKKEPPPSPRPFFVLHDISAWSVKTRKAPSRHCRGCEGLRRVYGLPTAAMHKASTTPPPPPIFLNANNFTFAFHATNACYACNDRRQRRKKSSRILDVGVNLAEPNLSSALRDQVYREYVHRHVVCNMFMFFFLCLLMCRRCWRWLSSYCEHQLS